jgi:hypothetical protein
LLRVLMLQENSATFKEAYQYLSYMIQPRTEEIKDDDANTKEKSPDQDKNPIHVLKKEPMKKENKKTPGADYLNDFVLVVDDGEEGVPETPLSVSSTAARKPTKKQTNGDRN